MSQPWMADPNSAFLRQLGDNTSAPYETCPDLWELENGDFAIIGSDLTDEYSSRLPEGVSIAPYERLVVLPRARIVSSKKDIPDV
ncbi:hypothetical protein [Amycolatopsis sp.]|uniref:hypothetical protein n=1 Tax=Amycolatopsis sp. TaxID=37632 RepID=UPI002D809CA2|nr:hypothetical protein [Amycolatopsis sp.]HET6704101.1 hypothetical protein [Amycolatopsis sp.]